MPDGQQMPVDVDLDPVTEAKAFLLQKKAYRFEIEMLSTMGTGMPDVSMEIVQPDGEPLCGRLAVNGPDVIEKATAMIAEGHALVFGEEEENDETRRVDGSNRDQPDTHQAIAEAAKDEGEGRSGPGSIDQGPGGHSADPCSE